MKQNKPRVTVVSFIGKPFAGKDFQAKRFKDNYSGVDFISTGALLRDQELLVRSGFNETQVDSINKKRDKGIAIDDGVVEQLAHQAILERAREGNTMILLAGHPRAIHQLRDMQKWGQEQNENGEFAIKSVYISFQIAAREANKRRGKRLQEEGRTDDMSMWKVRRRHFVFRKNVWPMFGLMELKALFGKGDKLHIVHAGEKPDEVTEQVENVLKPYLPERKKPEGQGSQKER